MKAELGKHGNRDVKFDMENAPNKNIAIFGLSGGGKSVEGQKLAIEIAVQGGTVVMFDHRQVLGVDEIFWKYREEFYAYLHEIDAYENGIPCRLFEPLTHPDGIREHPVDIICALIDALDRTLKFGCTQKTALRLAVTYMIEDGTYEKEGFKALDKALERVDIPVAETVRDKLYLLTVHNIFHSGESFIQKGKINVIRLSKFDLGTQETVVEMVLSYIWRLAATNYFKRNELFLFVDEFQNLPSGRRSSLAQMLSEGRKFGINLILATQRLPQSNATEVHRRLMQAGLILYFRPSADQIRTAAKLIDPENVKDWMKVLQDLGKGEFVASGALEISGHRIRCPLRISAFEKI